MRLDKEVAIGQARKVSEMNSWAPNLVGIRRRCHGQTQGSPEEELVCGEWA